MVDCSIKLAIKVVPGSSREGIVGWLGDALKVRVKAPAKEGKANLAVEEIVSHALGLPKGSARIVGGRTSARKVIEIKGLSRKDIDSRLADL